TFVIGQTAHRFAAGNLLRQRRATALDCVFVRRINRLPQKRAAPRHGESNARMDASPATPSSDQPSNPLPPDVPASPPPEAPRRGVSWLGAAVAGGGLVLAVLGLVSLILSRDNGVSALDARVAGVDVELRGLPLRAPPPPADPRALEAGAGRVARLEAAGAAPPPSASDPALAARIAALDAEVKAMAEAVGVLGRRSDEALAAAREARVRADAGAAEL